MVIDPRDTQTWTLLSQTTRGERLLLTVLGRFTVRRARHPEPVPPPIFDGAWAAPRRP